MRMRRKRRRRRTRSHSSKKTPHGRHQHVVEVVVGYTKGQLEVRCERGGGCSS